MSSDDFVPGDAVTIASVSVTSYIDPVSGDMHYCQSTSGDAPLSTMIGLHMFGVLELWEQTREERHP